MLDNSPNPVRPAPCAQVPPPPDELRKMGIELIVSRDMGWRNASRTRNIGVSRARGEVLCFIDDDAGLDFEKLLQILRAFRSEEGCFLWFDPPHLMIVHASAFLRAGGYDERFRPTMGETVELRLRLKRMGLRELPFTPEMVNLRHLKEHPDPRYMLNQKHLTWAYLEYRHRPLWRLVWRKKPTRSPQKGQVGPRVATVKETPEKKHIQRKGSHTTLTRVLR